MNDALWSAVSAQISAACGQSFEITDSRRVGGGSINSAHFISSGTATYFIKLNSVARLDMFEAEAEGLVELAAPGLIHVPEPLCYGRAGGRAFLVMEAIPMGRGDTESMCRFGRALAALHRVTHPRFGWHRHNTIGSTPQSNTETSDWVAFYREQRLRDQLERAAGSGHGRLMQRGEHLLSKLDRFFTDHQPPPSLLHGDLWSGNYAIDTGGNPVIYDPAVYYGDREADLAMTELFGGFGKDFYAAYNEAWPIDPGYRVRKTLYNLYHIINHVNLFGDCYLGQAEGMLEQLLAEV